MDRVGRVLVVGCREKASTPAPVCVTRCDATRLLVDHAQVREPVLSLGDDMKSRKKSMSSSFTFGLCATTSVQSVAGCASGAETMRKFFAPWLVRR